MKKFALGLIAAATATAGAFAFAPSANAAPNANASAQGQANAASPNTAKIGCFIVTPNGNVATVSVAVVAFENSSESNGVPMPWNCLQ